MIKSKCVPVLLYGLEACALNKLQIAWLDFVVNRLFMERFNTSNTETVTARLSAWATRRWKPHDPTAINFESIQACDGQTDRHAAYMSMSSTAKRDKTQLRTTSSTGLLNDNWASFVTQMSHTWSAADTCTQSTSSWRLLTSYLFKRFTVT